MSEEAIQQTNSDLFSEIHDGVCDVYLIAKDLNCAVDHVIAIKTALALERANEIQIANAEVMQKQMAMLNDAILGLGRIINSK